MSEEQNRFSLRKLSVGLASVLVGVSIFGTSQTVKADTVANNQTSSVTNNAQSSDTQENKNAAKSSFSSDNQVDNVKSNLIQTQVEAKKDQKHDSVPNTQEATDGNNLDAEKDIVRTSSLQESDNQSNHHAEDNSQPQTSQKLDLTKNSPKFAKKVLATNLTQDNSSQDISKITDPSKIDASHFADGTHWTPAGWTRTDKNTKVAKSSKLTIDWLSKQFIDSNGIYHDTVMMQPQPNVVTQHLDFTIDKNDMKAGNSILVGTIQQLPTNDKQSTSDMKQPTLMGGNMASQTVYDSNGKQVGSLYFSIRDNAEADFLFNPAVTINNLVNDPSFSVDLGQTGRFFIADKIDDGWWKFDKFYSKNNNLKYPLHFSLVTNGNTLNYQITKNDSVSKPVDKLSFNRHNMSVDSTNMNVGIYTYNIDSQAHWNTSDPGFVFKLQRLGNTPFSLHGDVWASGNINIYDANGQMTNENVNLNDNVTSEDITQTTKNMSALDLWNTTKDGESKYSEQADGSLLVCVKINFKLPTKDQIEQSVAKSYLANVGDPAHYQQIIDNTVKNTQGYSQYTIGFHLNVPDGAAIRITDVTPNSVIHHTNVGSNILQNNYHSSSSHDSGGLETYKNVKISYIDDDATDQTKSNISSDSMTGRQNKASIYTVNIPKGYYLDDNNISTGYTWNADHTAITYTFNEDQAKNNANPIEIHLKHKHTAVTDSSQLHATGKRTITVYLPHHDQPMIIVQTVGYKRTGDLDEATNTPTYTDWVFDADTSNVTVDGQHSTQYQSYILKDGAVNYAPIKLPHINGYKTKLIQDKANPAMFMVSFMAVPTENKPSIPVEEAPSKPSAPADNPNKPTDDLQQRVVTKLNSNDSGWTMPNTQPTTYTVEVPADDAIIDLSDLVIAEPVHAQTTTQIRVTKRFKLRKHGKKHVAKHLKHRKKAVRTFKKYRL